MNTIALALTIASLTVSASVAGIAITAGPDIIDDGAGEHSAHDAGAYEPSIDHGIAGDGPHGHTHEDGPGMERPMFPEAMGKTPTAETARSMEQISRIQIRSDHEATPATGIRSGNGTLDDPFIISDYYVTGDLYLGDTDACYVIKENYIGQQLSLNWNGQCVHVHHNYITDLRVNENIRRVGYATGGLLEMNVIEYIGQLRHYDGEVRHNVIGPIDPDGDYAPVLETVPWEFTTDPRVANIDGFNQGMIHHNTFYGSVDLDLHGHHHGTGFFAPHSHYHGDEPEIRGMKHDHTMRWTSVSFTDNKIVDPEGYGLRYEDRNHAGDDQTATSEQEETLELPHRHWTHIEMSRNVIEQGQLWVDVFNADDRLHEERNPGTLLVQDNMVTLHERKSDGPAGLPFFGPGMDWTSAMHVTTAKEVELVLTGNQLRFVAAPQSDELDLWMFDDNDATQPTGILLDHLRDANVIIHDNTFDGFHYAVRASQFDEAVHWDLSGNDYGGAAYEAYYDESVANRPTQDGAAEESSKDDEVKDDEAKDEPNASSGYHNHSSEGKDSVDS